MFNHLTTGAAARLLGRREPHLADLVRKGKIQPEPTIVAGRRLWTADQVRLAAERFGRLTPEVEQAITTAFTSEEVTRG